MNVSEMVVDRNCWEMVHQEISLNPSLRFNVLVADDCEMDRILARMALADSKCLKIVGEARDGLEAMNYLAGIGPFSDRGAHPFPDLLLLDFEMPYFNGAATLEWIREHSFPDLMVVMFSGSLDAERLELVTRLGCDFVQAKTSRLDELADFARRLEVLLVCKRKCLGLDGKVRET